MKSLNNEFFKELEQITELSERVNKNNIQKIFTMIKEHSL